MCGIVFLAGPAAGARITECVARLRHRGPDEVCVWSEGRFALGFARLEINGNGACGRQPHRHGGFIGATNGEIYNHLDLAAMHGLRPSPCDTDVVLPLFERLGPRVIDELDGFYSAVVLRPSSGEVICLRDHVGKKPLLVGRSGQEIFVVSELKALDMVDWFGPAPLGVSTVEPRTGEVGHLAEHRLARPRRGLAELLDDAVRKRLPAADRRVGVFLSGGVDSSMVAALVARTRSDATCFTLGDADGVDRAAVESLGGALGLSDVRVVPLPPADRYPALLCRIVEVTESWNPSIVSNGLATFLLAEAAHAAGIRVVLTGDGADELFGGYHILGPDDPWREVRAMLVANMHATELRRLDLSCMAHAVEARCPFLDRSVHAFSDGLGHHDLYGADENKVALRRSAVDMLPADVVRRRKTSLDVGSGVRGAVVRSLRRNGRGERDELRDLWHRRFANIKPNQYVHAYPAFDAAIDIRGAAHR